MARVSFLLRQAHSGTAEQVRLLERKEVHPRKDVSSKLLVGADQIGHINSSEGLCLPCLLTSNEVGLGNIWDVDLVELEKLGQIHVHGEDHGLKKGDPCIHPLRDTQDLVVVLADPHSGGLEVDEARLQDNKLLDGREIEA